MLGFNDKHCSNDVQGSHSQTAVQDATRQEEPNLTFLAAHSQQGGQQVLILLDTCMRHSDN